MEGLINIQNEDNKCFRWCSFRYLNIVIKNPIKIRNVGRELEKQLNLKGIKFPVYRKRLCKNRKTKKILPLVCLSINVKYHTIFKLQTKLLKTMLIYYYYEILKIFNMY